MKIFLALVLLAALASAEIRDQKIADYRKSANEMKKHKEDCIKELEISDAKMAEYDKSFREDTIKPHNNDITLNCLVKCVFEKQQIFDDKNGFNLKEFKKLVLEDGLTTSSDEVDIIFENCKYEFYLATGVCQRAFQGVMCVIRQITERQRIRFSKEQ